MAIDPGISLGVRPPVIPPSQILNPVEQFGQILSLRNLMTQGQGQQLELQTKQLGLQEAQRQADDEAKLRANPNLTDTELIGTLGSRAIPLLKARSELYEQQLKTNAQKAARLGQLAGSAVDAPSYQNAIMTAVSEKLMDPEHGRQLSALDWNDPDTQSQVKQFQQQALTAEQQHNAALADAKAKREEALAPFQLSEAQSKARQSALQNPGQTIQSLTDMSQFPAWLAKQPAEAQMYYRGLENMPLDQVKQVVGMAAVAPKPGETIPLPGAVQKQKVEQQAAIGLATEQAKQGFQNTQNESLVNAVMKDPTGVVYANLPGEKQKELAPILAQRGWTQFAAKPSDTELTKMQDIQKAVGIARTLKSAIAENSDLVGPISGELTKFPYATERKKLQAQIDLARQIIGKGLEGGVLRKEDEEKYKNILPTMTDTPDVAKSKLDQLDQLLTRDLGTYRQTLKGGQAFPDTAVQTPPPAPSDQAPAGSTPGLEVSKPGAEPKMVWIGPDGKKYYKAPPVQQITVTDPRGVVHTFKTAKQAEDFKKAAGIQ